MHTPTDHPRIYTRCPSCHNDTLTISDGHLLCTWFECKDPTMIDRVGEPSQSLPSSIVVEATLDDVFKAVRDLNKEQPLPSDLSKAIESLKIELLRKERDWQEWFLKDINTVLAAAKQVQELQQELERAKDDRNKSGVQERSKYLPKIAELEQQSREQAALIEKLVEASGSLVAIWDIAGRFYFSKIFA